MAVRAQSSSNFFASLPSNLVIQARKNIRKIVAPIAALVVVLILWQLGSSVFQNTLPGPIQVVQETWDLIINPFWSDGDDKGLGWQTLASLQRVAIGYSLAAFFGILAGVLIGAVPLLYDAFDPMFQILRTVPPLAWLPIALAIFKNSGPAGLFIIFVTAIWPILYNTAVGVQQMPQDYKNVAKVLRLSKQEYFFKILLPSIVPYMFTGLKLGIGLAWLAIVAAEMLRGDTGIGFFIWNSYNSGSLSEVILALVYIGVVGFLLDKLVGVLANLVSSDK
ncbi:nitrate ABC transporter permease [Stenomitos frigidus]|uniref:Nitrate ABC transporter, permease protein n=1 Tax=Stenomitos frigidus ULC18 TaxID=2107698 RepID=A0A2T1EF39_9CYAN|nr:nitrate ABC transporter permease [Stenomitos frigidus]PSB31313.1 nitrate ABC transporter, permease protein [Stenomitos frigidus ULC18]